MKFSLITLALSATAALAAPLVAIHEGRTIASVLSTRQDNVRLTFRDDTNTVIWYVDVPLDGNQYSIPTERRVYTMDPYDNFHSVNCFIGSADGGVVDTTWDKNTLITSFNPSVLIGTIECCVGCHFRFPGKRRT